MYPDLSYLLHDLIGTEPDNWTSVFKTFGFLLVLAILSAALFFYLELKRKADEGIYQADKIKVLVGKPASVGELLSNGLFGFVVGFKFVYLLEHFAEFKRNAALVLLSTKGEWWAGILLALVFAGYLYWDKKKQALPKPKEMVETVFPHDRIGDLTIIAAITGILGAKVFAIIEDLPAFFDDPVGIFFSGSGLAIYGGLIAGFLGVTWYLRKHEIPFWHTADAVAPALIIAYGVGRIGCQLAGDGDWGIPAAAEPAWWFLPDWFWSFDYPNNVNNVGIPIPDCTWHYCSHLKVPVYPTPLYEIVLSFLIGGFLWAIRKRITIPGTLFSIYLILNGIERFWVERIRVNIKYDVLGFQWTQAQIIAFGLILAGILSALFLWRRQKGG